MALRHFEARYSASNNHQQPNKLVPYAKIFWNPGCKLEPWLAGKKFKHKIHVCNKTIEKKRTSHDLMRINIYWQTWRCHVPTVHQAFSTCGSSAGWRKVTSHGLMVWTRLAAPYLYVQKRTPAHRHHPCPSYWTCSGCSALCSGSVFPLRGCQMCQSVCLTTSKRCQQGDLVWRCA